MQKNNELFSFEDKDENKISNEDFLRLPRREIKTKKPLLCLQHLGARAIRDRYPKEIWDNCFKFAFVSNPWDRMVSHPNSVRPGLA